MGINIAHMNHLVTAHTQMETINRNKIEDVSVFTNIFANLETLTKLIVNIEFNNIKNI